MTIKDSYSDTKKVMEMIVLISVFLPLLVECNTVKNDTSDIITVYSCQESLKLGIASLIYHIYSFTS